MKRQPDARPINPVIDIRRSWPSGSAAEAAEQYRAARLQARQEEVGLITQADRLIPLADECVTRALNEAELRTRDPESRDVFAELPRLTGDELDYLYRAIEAEMARPGQADWSLGNSLRTAVGEARLGLRRRL